MLTYIESGSIFDSDCSVLVCPVNCIGVMGGGLAKEFRERFPVASGKYKKHCFEGHLQPGRCQMEFDAGKVIVFAATKDHWRDPSRLEWVETCLERIIVFFSPGELGHDGGCRSVAIPALGCGLGQLRWDDVKASIERITVPDGLRVDVYSPQETQDATGA